MGRGTRCERLTPLTVVAERDRLGRELRGDRHPHGQRADVGIPATGKRVRFSEIRVRRIEDGKFAEYWGLPDATTLLVQLQRAGRALGGNRCGVSRRAPV